MAGAIVEGNIMSGNFLNSSSNSDTVSYEHLELWLVQLFNWVAYEPNLLEKFKRGLADKFSGHLEEISDLVDGGEFIDNKIDISGKPIRFPKYRFKVNIGSNNSEIPCEMRIRINPCEKEAIFTDDLDLRTSEDDQKLEAILNKLESFGIHKISPKQIAKDAWSFTDKNTDFLVLINGTKIQVFNRDLSPFSSKVIIIITPIGRFSFNEDEKQQFFKFAEERAKETIKRIGPIYIPISLDLETLPKAIIKSAGTTNQKLLDLVDKKREDSLSFAIKKDSYIEDVMDGVVSSLYGTKVTKWLSRQFKSEGKNLDQITWKLVESDDSKGFYGTARMKNTTMISAIFFVKDSQNSAAYKIVRAWVEDLIKRL
jgi:hypothetical protein